MNPSGINWIKTNLKAGLTARPFASQNNYEALASLTSSEVRTWPLTTTYVFGPATTIFLTATCFMESFRSYHYLGRVAFPSNRLRSELLKRVREAGFGPWIEQGSPAPHLRFGLIRPALSIVLLPKPSLAKLSRKSKFLNQFREVKKKVREWRPHQPPPVIKPGHALVRRAFDRDIIIILP